MKNFLKFSFLVWLLSMVTVVAFGQKYSAASGGGFDIESGIDTGNDITIDGDTYDVFKTASKGSLYVKSPKGHAVWIGNPHPKGDMFEGRPVRLSTNKKTPLVLKSVDGHPAATYLKLTGN